jgi:hypothetical protein
MVDGTGMCGGCRVIVGGKPQFACVDGPEFDAHQVDFQILIQRNAMYRDLERQALDPVPGRRIHPPGPPGRPGTAGESRRVCGRGSVPIRPEGSRTGGRLESLRRSG